MLSASVITLLLLAVTGAAVRGKFSWWSLIVSIGVLEVLGLVLLGLPGGAFLEAIEPLVRGVGLRPISPNGAWPAAIMMSVAWPIALAPAYLVARSVQLSNGQRGLVALGVLVPTCLLVGVVVYAIAA